jgi:heme oxygenase (mycobilin-producing)
MSSDPAPPQADASPVTLINVFEVPAEHVDEFVEQWRSRAQLMSEAKGFRDSRLHRAVSSGARFQLVNVAHWDSQPELEAAQGDPRFQASLRALRGEGRPPFTSSPAVYRVAQDYPAPSPAPEWDGSTP